MRVTIQGAIPFPPNADSAPIRRFAGDLRQFVQTLQQTSSKMTQTSSFVQQVWKGAAAAAQQGRADGRRQVVQQVAGAVGTVIPVLDTYAAALDTAAAAYTAAASAEMAARGGLPWTAAALAAAIAAEAAAVGGLQAAAGAGAGAAAGPIARIAGAQFLGIDQGSANAKREATASVWESVKETLEDGEVSEQEMADAARRLEEAFDALDAARSATVADPESPTINPDTGLPASADYWDGVIDQILVDGVTDPVAPTEATTLRDQVFGTESREIDLDLARLARDVYPASAGELPAGSPYVRATDQQLRELGIDPARLQNDATGFSAAVYFTRDGNQAVLAFAGTDEAVDWATNLGQGTSAIAGQYAQGRALAEDLAVRYGDNLAIVGHSLGGGIASYAALATDTPAVTFNAAGLSMSAQLQSGTLPWKTDGVAESGLIRRYTVDNEVLTFYQEDNPATDLAVPDAVGTRIRLSEPEAMPAWSSFRLDDRVDRHGIDVVIDAMERDRPWTGSPQAATGTRDEVPATHGATGSW